MHLGQTVRKLRDFRGIKQDTIANQLGMTQQNYSHIENGEHINDDLLIRIAAIIDFPVEVIKNLEKDGHQTIFNSGSITESVFQQFNPVEKLIEVYERLLKSEKEKYELLQKLMQK